MPSGEVDTSFLVSEVLDSGGLPCEVALIFNNVSQGRTLFVPKITTNSGDMEFLKLYDKADLANLPNGIWGIKEPDPNWQGRPRVRALETSELDLILLPAVAFDRSFARLGHGKGYYDRFITRYQATFHKKPLLVGLALREQLLERERIPMDKHDWSMDYIITPDEILVNSTSMSFDASASAG